MREAERGEDGRSLVGVSRRRHAINALPDHKFLKTNSSTTKKNAPQQLFAIAGQCHFELISLLKTHIVNQPGIGMDYRLSQIHPHWYLQYRHTVYLQHRSF